MNTDCNVSTPFKGSKINVPTTPFLHKIGFGTGVSVYHMERSPQLGLLRSPWAVKKVNQTSGGSAAGVNGCYSERVRREADILKTLDHPNIVGFRGYVKTDEGKEMLVMEECSESLGGLIEKYRAVDLGPMEPQLIYTVVQGVAAALHYLHTVKNLLHGDIKSYNILIKGDFEAVKLCDFGVSLQLDAEGRAPAEDYVGTPSWSPPEVARVATLEETQDDAGSCGHITGKADVFALGLTIWEMLALCPPHTDPEESMNDATIDLESTGGSYLDECETSFDSKIGTRPPLPEVTLGSEYKEVIDLFNWCTEADPNERPSAQQILDRLKTIEIK